MTIEYKTISDRVELIKFLKGKTIYLTVDGTRKVSVVVPHAEILKWFHRSLPLATANFSPFFTNPNCYYLESVDSTLPTK